MNIKSLSLLQVAFIFCKLAGVTEIKEWPWWIVLAPVWIYFLIMVGLYTAIFIITMVEEILKDRSKSKRRE